MFLILFVVLLRIGQGLSQCYVRADCTGSTVTASTERGCCAATNDGLSFQSNGVCSTCVVHGFGNTAYSVQEGEALNILFELNVKGMTQFGSSLFIPGNVTVEYDSSERPVLFHQVSSSINISVQLIALYVQSNKTITLRFTPDNPAFVPGLEGVGEYVRDTAVVNVTNNEALGMPMVTIGFTQRSQTVSEASVLPGRDLLHLPGIAAAAQTPVTREYTVVFEHVEFSSTAIVNGIPVDPGFDALFGLRSARPLQYLSLLRLGEAIIPPPSVAIRNDFVIEELECFTIRIFISGGTQFMCNNEDTASNFFCTHTICIEDDDGPFVVEFVKTVYTVDESVGSVSVCVNLTQPEIDILDETVRVFIIDNPNSTYIPTGAPLTSPDPPNFLTRYSMIEGSDYAQQTSAVNLIDDMLISELNRIICYNQTIYDDTLVEANEYLGLSLGVIDGGSTTVLTLVNPMYGEASILILDNDGPISFGFDSTVYTTSEGQGMMQVRIVVQTPSTGGTPQPFSVSVSTTDDTAVSPDDYVAISGQIIQFNIGDTSHSLTLSIANDEMCETQTESFFVSISLVSSTGSITISLSQAQVFINDVNEPECVPTLSLSSGTYVALENEGSVEVCVVLNIPLNIPLDLTITTTATSSTDGEDFVGGQFPLILLPGQTQECIDITLIDDDTALEGREMFRVELSTLFFPVPIDISTAEVTIIDNDMVECPTLNDPNNGNLTLSGNTFGQTAEYTCNKGFNLVGESIQMCGADGQWIGDSPVCEAVQCPDLTSPMNGSLLISGTGVGVYQETATYACETGFNLVGSVERTCQSDGTWSGSAPTCQIVECPTLNDPANGNVELSGNSLGDSAEYTCNSGYNLADGHILLLICGSEGQWIGNPPVCIAVPVSLSCTATGLSEVAINCDGVGPDTSLQCSFSGGPFHSCNLPILLTSNVSPPGSKFNVTILESTGGEDTVTYDITNTKTDVSASVPPLEVILTGGSPRVTESSVEADFVTTRPVTGVRCFLRYENKNDYKDCYSGSVSFTGLKPGRYVLKMFAYNKLTDVAAIKRVVNV